MLIYLMYNLVSIFHPLYPNLYVSAQLFTSVLFFRYTTFKVGVSSRYVSFRQPFKALKAVIFFFQLKNKKM